VKPSLATRVQNVHHRRHWGSSSYPKISNALFHWVRVRQGDPLPGGIVESGTAHENGEGGPAYVARSIADEPGAIGLLDGAGPRRMNQIRCAVGGYFKEGDVLVLGTACAPAWKAVQTGHTLGGGDVCFAKDRRGNPVGAWWRKGHLRSPTSSCTIVGFSHQPSLPESSPASPSTPADEVDVLVVERVEAELRVAVLRSEGLKDPEYRIGDNAGIAASYRSCVFDMHDGASSAWRKPPCTSKAGKNRLEMRPSTNTFGFHCNQSLGKWKGILLCFQ